jgi:hypothetical protein
LNVRTTPSSTTSLLLSNMAKERWLGLSEQGSATDKWIVCRLFPRTTDMGRQAGRA